MRPHGLSCSISWSARNASTSHKRFSNLDRPAGPGPMVWVPVGCSLGPGDVAWTWCIFGLPLQVGGVWRSGTSSPFAAFKLIMRSSNYKRVRKNFITELLKF
ncbi:hypothetical protein TWF132_007487 [Orbilia oligospora]|nr:hypothetical protein TWF132_007487 [Orbilia oligospora]